MDEYSYKTLVSTYYRKYFSFWRVTCEKVALMYSIFPTAVRRTALVKELAGKKLILATMS